MIMSLFNQLMATGQSVRLVNAYRGIPIVSDASISLVGQGCVAVETNELQAVSMFLEGKTLLRCQPLTGSETAPSDFRATVVGVDIVARRTTLSEFASVENEMERRLAIRVQPEELVDVEVNFEEHRTVGKLADISVSGLGVFSFDAYIYSDLVPKRNLDVTISFALPPSKQKIQFLGKVVHIAHRGDPRLRRVGLKIAPDPAVEPLLRKYVAQRQEELLRELKFIYDSMLALRKVGE